MTFRWRCKAGRKPGHLIYSSDSDFGRQEVVDADGTMDLFGRLQGKVRGSPIHVFHKPSENTGPAASVGISWFPLLPETAEDQDWQLIVRHRRGGALGTFVAETRRRDLAFSFGVLLLLVISIAMLIITSHRAQRLAKLQMDFVTAVSHELRTPLTVISSAADNIAHGVVEGKQQLAQYGSVIGSQARQLFGLVERILLFARTREGHLRYGLRPLSVPEIIETALASTAGLIEAAQFTVEREIEPNLPQVMGDLLALSQCLQNLITNALKYGSEQRWMGIRAGVSEHGVTGRENPDQHLGSRHRDRLGGSAAHLRAVLSQSVCSGRTDPWHGLGLAASEEHCRSDERTAYGYQRAGTRKHLHVALALCRAPRSGNRCRSKRCGRSVVVVVHRTCLRPLAPLRQSRLKTRIQATPRMLPPLHCVYSLFTTSLHPPQAN